MIKTTGYVGALLLLMSACAFADATFVGIDKLDDVFDNYSREGDAGWTLPGEKLATSAGEVNGGDSASQLSELRLLTAADLEKVKAESEKKSAAKKPVASRPAESGWKPLFAADLSNADFSAGIWTVSNGELTASQDKLIMTKASYETMSPWSSVPETTWSMWVCSTH